MVSDSRLFGSAIVGGFLGSLVMAVILVASKLMMGLPAMADFVIMGTFAGADDSTAMAVGWIAHVLTGVAAGLIFGLVTGYVSKFRVSSTGRGIMLGALFGFVVYIVFFIPVLMLGLAPVMMALMGPASSAMAPIILGIGLIEHLLYGSVLGTAVAIGTR